MARRLNISLVQETRPGGRPYNQDRVAHWMTADALLLVVADGMGGYAGGELAARAAVESIGAAFREQAQPALADPEAFLASAPARAHTAIAKEAARAGLGDAPRTTLVACVVQGGDAYWTFVGDSRFYLIREGRILARTKDHTYVQQLIDAGRMREEAAAAHPERNRLLRCLGGPTAPRREPVARASLAKEDIILLCSDGLWAPLTPRLLLMGLTGKDPRRAVPELMRLAQAHGGRDCDNLSALAMQWHADAA
jgi:serine/threonine protein phosphatase PrpC